MSDAPPTTLAHPNRDLSQYHKVRSRAARLQTELAEERKVLEQDIADLRRKYHQRVQERVDKMEDYEDAMYDFRRKAQRHLRREIRRVESRGLDQDRERRAVQKLMAAYEAHVNPDDDLSRSRRASMAASLGGGGPMGNVVMTLGLPPPF